MRQEPSADASLRPVTATDRPWIDRLIAEAFGAPAVVSRGQVLRPSDLRGWIAEQGGRRVGLVTIHVDGAECEVVTLNSLRPGGGIGAALLDAAARHARTSGCDRLVLVTTNDNTRALHTYQRFGMRITAIHIGAVDAARALKPEIPLIGEDGIAIHDEIELAIELN